MKNILRVIQQTEPIQVPSQKAESGTIAKSYITLQELGGPYENKYLVTLFGNAATCKYFPGDIVFAALRFSTHEHNGSTFQDIVATEILKAI
jgi:hypothetical protein